MVPDGRRAECPGCGQHERAERHPVFVVTGASGSGKTTLLPHLIVALAGSCIVFDVDWLIDPFARQPGNDELHWPSLRDAWLHVAHGVAQNGLPTLLLGPFIPEHLEDLRGRRWISNIQYLVLDCPDDVRRRRLEARPPWRERAVDEHLSFAAWLRTNLSPVVDTATSRPEGTAAAVATWVRTYISR